MTFVHDTVAELVFKDMPLGNSIIGTQTSLSKITRPVITGYKERAYTRDSIVVSVAGNFDEEDMCEYLSDKFSGLAASKEHAAGRKAVHTKVQGDKQGYQAGAYLHGNKEHKP